MNNSFSKILEQAYRDAGVVAQVPENTVGFNENLTKIDHYRANEILAKKMRHVHTSLEGPNL
ncbi:hypothetical protein P5704_024960 (plasmid) [Pseudomonas sp. FeN3W]|nr:hypothetical protein P5704_024960 [Pseudomonas sp. FeN3W]